MLFCTHSSVCYWIWVHSIFLGRILYFHPILCWMMSQNLGFSYSYDCILCQSLDDGPWTKFLFIYLLLFFQLKETGACSLIPYKKIVWRFRRWMYSDVAIRLNRSYIVISVRDSSSSLNTTYMKHLAAINSLVSEACALAEAVSLACCKGWPHVIFWDWFSFCCERTCCSLILLARLFLPRWRLFVVVLWGFEIGSWLGCRESTMIWPTNKLVVVVVVRATRLEIRSY